jgi:surface antigen
MTPDARQTRRPNTASWHRWLWLGALLAHSSLAGAAGWVAVLKNTPAEVFQADDLRLFLDTAKQVLEAPGPAQTVNWSNAATGAGGSFRVLSESVARDGGPCRRVRFSVYAPKRPAKTALWTACQIPTGQWKLATAG